MPFSEMTKRPVGYAVKKPDLDQLIDNDNDLNGRLEVASGGVANGSFETDDGTDPTSWVKTTTGGGTGAMETTDRRHGKQAIKATVTIGGDSVAYHSDTTPPTAPIPVAVGERIACSFNLIASAAGVQVDVDIMWWYWTGSAFSAASTASSSIYSSAANPTSWARRNGSVFAPAGANDAEFYTVRLTVAHAAAGNVILDGVETRVLHGSVPLTRTSKGTISTDDTTPIDITSQIGANEAATFVQVTIDITIVDTTATFAVQGWVGGSFVTVASFGGVAAQMSVVVPLNDSNKFQVVSTNTAGGDSAVVYIGGKYKV